MRLTLIPCMSFRQRLLGLHGVRPLAANEGLWIRPCRAVHTLALAQSLDVVFLDAHDAVIRICANVRPNCGAWCWRASSVVELSAGFCQRHPDYAQHIAQQCRAIRRRLAGDAVQGRCGVGMMRRRAMRGIPDSADAPPTRQRR